MKCLITGIAGFVGSHLFEHICKNTDWEIVGLDRLDVAGNLNRIAEVLEGNPEFKSRFKFVFHDLKAELNPTVANDIGDINYVYHLAASSHVDRSITDPMGFVMDNVVGTTNILNWARQVDGLDKFLYANTDEIFGDAPIGVNYTEKDLFNPKNPYSGAKCAAGMMCNSYYHTFELPIIQTCTMNMYGQKQVEKFVPTLIKKIYNEEEVDIHVDDSNKPGSRGWIHARNASAAWLFLTDYGTVGELYNMPAHKELDNLEMAELIAKYIGKPLKHRKVNFHNTIRGRGHDLRYGLDGTKLTNLGFKYPIGFEESLKETVWWTLTNRRWL